MAWASTVAVVVPSPASSLVRSDFLHHLRAHVLELVSQFDFLGDGDAVLGDGRGAEALSSTTLRPFGPRVTLTALARTLTPRTMRERASSPKRISLAAIAFTSLVAPDDARRLELGSG
jgi:hypothetical protein